MVKLLNSRTNWFGIGGNGGNEGYGPIYEDLKKINEKIGDPFNTIKNIKVKKIWITYDDTRVWGLQFFYQFITNTERKFEIEGYKSFESIMQESTIEIPDDDYLVKVKVGAGQWTDWIQFQFAKQQQKFYGKEGGGSPYEINNPGVLFYQFSRGRSAIGFYLTESYTDNVQSTETPEEKLRKWESITHTNNPDDFKIWWDKVIKDHWVNNFKEKYGYLSDGGLLKIKADLDKLAKWQDAFPVDKYPNGAADITKLIDELQNQQSPSQQSSSSTSKPVNLKLKITNKQTPFYGSTDGEVKDDLLKIAEKLEVRKEDCFDLITDIRPKQLIVRGGAVIDGIKFTYQVETKDGKKVEVEGHQHGGTGGTENTWVYGGYNLFQVKGSYGSHPNINMVVKSFEFHSFKQNEYNVIVENKGTSTGNTAFSLTTPACFISRTIDQPSILLGAISAWTGEVYDVDLQKAQTEITELNQIKKTYDELIKYWNENADIRQVFAGKPLSVDALKDAEKSVKIAKLLDQIFTYWREAGFVEQSGDINKKESWDKIKDKLTELKTWTDKFPFPLTLEQVKTKYDEKKEIHGEEDLKPTNLPDNWESELKRIPDLEKRPTQEQLNNAVSAETDKIKTLEFEWEQNFPDGFDLTPEGITKLREYYDDIRRKQSATSRELLKIKRQATKKELNLFRQRVGIDDDDINLAFSSNFDYEDVIDAQLTLDNEENSKREFKVLACILATKKVQELKKKSPDHGPKFRAILRKVKEGWEEVEKSPPASQEKSPFYLAIIDQWSATKQEFTALMKEFNPTLTKRKVELRGIVEPRVISVSSKDLSTQRTIFEILGSQAIKTEFAAYLNWLEEQYPSIKIKKEEIWQAKVAKEWDSFSNETDKSDWLVLIERFTLDNTIIEKVKTEAEKKLAAIFAAQGSDSEVKKYLKLQARAKLLVEFASCKADEIVYIVELSDQFYLGWLAEHLEEILKKHHLTLKALNLKDDALREKTFTDLYNSWDNTTDKSELDQLSKAINADVVEWNNLIAEAAKLVADELKTTTEKYQKEDLDGKPWTLTAAEKARIDQAANQEDLAKVMQEIMAERKLDQWIEDHISSKAKPEELPSEADIDSNAQLSSNAKEKAKWKLQEKQIELLPETTAKGKIKKHLTRVKFNWERWAYLVAQKDQTNPADYAMALMFAEGSEPVKKGFGQTVALEMLPKITTALAKDTLEGYRNLDQEWGQNILEADKVKYNEERDYYEVWKTLREYLYEDKANQDEWMKVHLRGVYGVDKFKEVEKQYQDLQAQIEIQNNTK